MSAMPTVAEQLRAAREAQGLTVNQVADATKIRGDHIRALEAGDFNVFTAPVYIKGFTRSCAGLLKLDVPQIMAQLEAELAQTEKFCEPPDLVQRPRSPLDYVMLQLSRVNWRKAGLGLGVLAVLALFVGGFLVWRHYATRDPLANLPPGVYQPAGQAPADTLALPPPK
jgi:cytoskeleton protein RodZ